MRDLLTYLHVYLSTYLPAYLPTLMVGDQTFSPYSGSPLLNVFQSTNNLPMGTMEV